MKSYIQGIITGGVFFFSFFVFIGQTNVKLSKENENWYRAKGWVQALFDLEINLGDRIDAVSRLISLEVNDIESDIKLLDERLKLLEEK
tara:strand:- start:85 stop:351 length:267 start_codon:yes stop_codon:yes gene_type:complete